MFSEDTASTRADTPGGSGDVQPPIIRLSSLKTAFVLFRAALWAWVGAALVFVLVWFAWILAGGSLMLTSWSQPSSSGVGTAWWMTYLVRPHVPHLLTLLMDVPGRALTYFLLGGMLLMAQRQLRGEPIRALDVFSVRGVWRPLAVTSILLAAVMALPSQFGLITQVLVGAPLLLVLPIVADGGASPLAAIARSASVLWRRLVPAAGLMLGFEALIFLSVIVSPFVTLPLIVLWLAVTYDEWVRGEAPSVSRRKVANAGTVLAGGCVVNIAGWLSLVAALSSLYYFAARVPAGHIPPIRIATLSGNGQTAAAACVFRGTEHSLVIWDVHSGKRLGPVALDAPAEALAVSADGRMIAVPSERTAVLFNGQVKVIKRLSTKDEDLRSLCFTDDGKRLAAVTGDGLLHIWDLQTWQSRQIGRKTSYDPRVGEVSPDSKTFAAGDYAGLRHWFEKTRINVMDAATGKAVASINCSASPATAVAFSPDGRSLATGHADGSVSTHVLESSMQTTLPQRLIGLTRSVALSSGGEAVAAVSSSSLVLWQAASRRVRLLRPPSPFQSFCSVSLSADGALALVAVSNSKRPLDNWLGRATGSTHLYDVRTGRMMKVLD